MRCNESVKQHSFDSNVIVKVLHVPEAWHRAGGVHMQTRCAVRGKRASKAARHRRGF
jgi:hypothetical protein